MFADLYLRFLDPRATQARLTRDVLITLITLQTGPTSFFSLTDASQPVSENAPLPGENGVKIYT